MTDTAHHAEPAKDNLLGVCACLGEDFGFNPLWLRLAFGIGIVLNMNATFVVYFGLGAIVLVSRLLVPNRKAADVPPVATTSPANEEGPALKQAA